MAYMSVFYVAHVLLLARAFGGIQKHLLVQQG